MMDATTNSCEIVVCVCVYKEDVLIAYKDIVTTCLYMYANHNKHSLQPKNVHISICSFRWLIPTEWRKET